MTILQDACGRTFPYLRLSITDVCNFRCQYCLPDGFRKPVKRCDPLTVDEIRRLVSAFAQVGTRKIRITGGEPSLRRDLPDIIRTLKQVDGIQHVALTTNGYKLSQQLPAWIEAGLDRINVSIDSLDTEQFALITGHDRLQEVLKGTELAQKHGLKVKINTVLMKRFFSDKILESYLGWLSSSELTLRFIELMETGDQPDFYQAEHLSGQTILRKILAAGWQPILRSSSAGPAQEYWHPDYVGRIGFIMPYSKDFCSNCNRLRVSSQGKLQLCLFAEDGFDLRELLQCDSQQDELLSYLHECLAFKQEQHQLHKGVTGSTQNLSLIGG